MPQLLPFGLTVTWKWLPERPKRERGGGGGPTIMRPYSIYYCAPHTHTHTHISTCAYRHTHPSPCGHLFSVHQDCRPNPRRIISSMPRLFMCNGSHLSPSLSPPMLPFAPSPPPPLTVPSSFRHNRSHCCSHKMPTPTFFLFPYFVFIYFFQKTYLCIYTFYSGL